MRYLTHLLLSSSSPSSPLRTRPLRDSFGLDAVPCWCGRLIALPSSQPADSVVPAARRLADAFRAISVDSSATARESWTDGEGKGIEMRVLRVRRPERALVVRGRRGEGMGELEGGNGE